MDRPLILVSNDDGIEAPGIVALSGAMAPLGEVWVVAPEGERSTSSHSLTLRRPVAVRQVGERRYAVKGWPADCVYLGMFGLLPRRPDLVVSGINRGPNLGTDVLYSGTVGAAREAHTRGVQALALSLVEGEDYSFAARFAFHLAAQVLALSPPAPPSLLNVNVPGRTAAGVRVTRLGARYYPEVATRCGAEDGWTLYLIGSDDAPCDAMVPGTDGAASAEGFVTITPLGLDCTDLGALAVSGEAARAAWEELGGPLGRGGAAAPRRER